MAWVLPRTWVPGEVVNASQFNEQIRDNLNYLLTPNAVMRVTAAGTLSTTSTTYASLGTAWALSLTTNGGHVLAGAQIFGSALNAATTDYTDMAIDVDGVAYSVALLAGTPPRTLAGSRLFTALASGAHTITLKWRVSQGVVTGVAACATLPTELWAVEI